MSKKSILLTGMSGTGKSSVIRELGMRGYNAHDLDHPDWSKWVDAAPSDDLTPQVGRDWVWREDRVRSLLSAPRSEKLFVSGCASNMNRFYPLIDVIILLSAPITVLSERLAARSPSAYGHAVDDRQKVAALVKLVEPLLRKSADVEIGTNKPTTATADEILRLV